MKKFYFALCFCFISITSLAQILSLSPDTQNPHLPTKYPHLDSFFREVNYQAVHFFIRNKINTIPTFKALRRKMKKRDFIFVPIYFFSPVYDETTNQNNSLSKKSELFPELQEKIPKEQPKYIGYWTEKEIHPMFDYILHFAILEDGFCVGIGSFFSEKMTFFYDLNEKKIEESKEAKQEYRLPALPNVIIERRTPMIAQIKIVDDYIYDPSGTGLLYFAYKGEYYCVNYKKKKGMKYAKP